VLNAIDTPMQPIETEVIKPIEKKTKKQKGDTQRESLKLFQEGKSVKEIAKERNLTTATVEGHLVSFIPTGETKMEDFVSVEKMNVILDFFRNNPESKHSSDAKNALGNGFSYVEIKAVMMTLKNHGEK
jgi:uncharacterized protein YpbB